MTVAFFTLELLWIESLGSLCVDCSLRFLERDRLIDFLGAESDDREVNMNKSSSMSVAE